MDEPIRKRTVAEPPVLRPDRTTPDGRVYRWHEAKQEWQQVAAPVVRPSVVCMESWEYRWNYRTAKYEPTGKRCYK